jgi:ribonucleoside-diphosphate reductase alpha chain
MRCGWSRPQPRRQKWIDQAQSLNIYMAGASGKKLDETYKLAWLRGLKTTYYLRTTSATLRREVHGGAGRMNAVCRRGGGLSPGRGAARRRNPQDGDRPATSSSARSTTPTCEACQ